MERAPERATVFHTEFREDLRYWVKSERATAIRVLDLVEAILRDPFQGLGKPEPLRFSLSANWSRRISAEHRLVYEVSDAEIIIVSCRFHY